MLELLGVGEWEELIILAVAFQLLLGCGVVRCWYKLVLEEPDDVLPGLQLVLLFNQKVQLRDIHDGEIVKIVGRFLCSPPN